VVCLNDTVNMIYCRTSVNIPCLIHPVRGFDSISLKFL